MDLEVSVLALVFFHCFVLYESLSKLRHRLTFMPCHYGYSMFNADIAVEPVDVCACSGAAARFNWYVAMHERPFNSLGWRKKSEDHVWQLS